MIKLALSSYLVLWFPLAILLTSIQTRELDDLFLLSCLWVALIQRPELLKDHFVHPELTFEHIVINVVHLPGHLVFVFGAQVF